MVRSGRNSNLSEILCMSSLPACIKRIWSKTSSPKGNDRSPELSNLPQNLMHPFPHPNDATHKILSSLVNWLHRYSSSKVWKFRHSRASNSKMSGLIRPKIELDRAFMPVLVTSNFDDDSIKNERVTMETPFSHYKSKGNVLDAQGQLTP